MANIKAHFNFSILNTYKTDLVRLQGDSRTRLKCRTQKLKTFFIDNTNPEGLKRTCKKSRPQVHSLTYLLLDDISRYLFLLFVYKM